MKSGVGNVLWIGVNMVEVKINKKTGIKFAQTLIESSHKLLNADKPVPEIRYSEGFEIGTQQHAIFLFYSIALDALRDSNKVYKAGRNLALRFTPRDIIKLAKSKETNSITTHKRPQLEAVMERFLDNGIGNPANILLQAALRLEETCKGDPRQLFNGAKVYEEAFKIISGYYGIGDGKASLMVKNFIRFGYLELEDNFDMPIKIDRHGIKMSIGNDVVSFSDYEEGEKIHIGNVTKRLERLFREITREEKISPVLLDDIKWANGNRLCTKKDFNVCQNLCSLNCSMLVKGNKSGTYVVMPSDTRTEGKTTENNGGQLSLF